MSVMIAVAGMAIVGLSPARATGEVNDAHAVVLAYHAAHIAKDLNGLAAKLSDDLDLRAGCCRSKSELVAYYREQFARPIQVDYVDYEVDGQRVTFRSRSRSEDDLRNGIPPVEVVEQAFVQNGKIVHMSGAVDESASQRRAAAQATHQAVLLRVIQQRNASVLATPTPEASTLPHPESQRTPSRALWVVIGGGALLGVVILGGFARPSREWR